MEGVVLDEAGACWWMKIRTTNPITGEEDRSGSRSAAGMDWKRISRFAIRTTTRIFSKRRPTDPLRYSYGPHLVWLLSLDGRHQSTSLDLTLLLSFDGTQEASQNLWKHYPFSPVHGRRKHQPRRPCLATFYDFAHSNICISSMVIPSLSGLLLNLHIQWFLSK